MSILTRRIRARVQSPNVGRQPTRPDQRLRLRIEQLEDRWVPATTYLVSSLADDNSPGTLRVVLAQANLANTGTAAAPDTIRFTTAGGTIFVTGAPLPALTDVAVIDATTATNYLLVPVIVLDGAA